MKKARMFISYSRADSAIADRLVQALTARGYVVFIDRAGPERGIAAGEKWWSRLQALIAQSDTMVFLVSPEALASPACEAELQYAQELSKRIMPVEARPSQVARGPAVLRALHVNISLHSGTDRQSGEAEFETAIVQLCKALDVDIVWLREQTRIVELALRWNETDHPDSQLLRGMEIAHARNCMAQQPVGGSAFPPWAQDFIEASYAKEVEEREDFTRRERRLAAQVQRLVAQRASLSIERNDYLRAMRQMLSVWPTDDQGDYVSAEPLLEAVAARAVAQCRHLFYAPRPLVEVSPLAFDGGTHVSFLETSEFGPYRLVTLDVATFELSETEMERGLFRRFLRRSPHILGERLAIQRKAHIRAWFFLNGTVYGLFHAPDGLILGDLSNLDIKFAIPDRKGDSFFHTPTAVDRDRGNLYLIHRSTACICSVVNGLPLYRREYPETLQDVLHVSTDGVMLYITGRRDDGTYLLVVVGADGTHVEEHVIDCGDHEFQFFELARNAATGMILVGLSDRPPIVLGGRTGAAIPATDWTTNIARALAFSPDGRWLVLVDARWRVELRDGNDLSLQWSFGELDAHPQEIVFSPCSTRFALRTGEGGLMQYDLRTYERFDYVGTGPIVQFVYADEGRVLAALSRYGGLHCWASEAASDLYRVTGTRRPRSIAHDEMSSSSPLDFQCDDRGFQVAPDGAIRVTRSGGDALEFQLVPDAAVREMLGDIQIERAPHSHSVSEHYLAIANIFGSALVLDRASLAVVARRDPFRDLDLEGYRDSAEAIIEDEPETDPQMLEQMMRALAAGEIAYPLAGQGKLDKVVHCELRIDDARQRLLMACGQWDLVSLDLRTQTERTLSLEEGVGDNRMIWSLVFSDDAETAVYYRAGGDLVCVDLIELREYARVDFHGESFFALAPDGRHLVCLEDHDPDSTLSLYRLPVMALVDRKIFRIDEQIGGISADFEAGTVVCETYKGDGLRWEFAPATLRTGGRLAAHMASRLLCGHTTLGDDEARELNPYIGF